MVEIASVMMALGAFRFGISTGDYQRLRRRAEFRWPVQERVGRAPASQFVGKGLVSVGLSGVIYPHFRGGLRQIEAMEALGGLGRPMMLVDGLGWVFDLWCILAVEQTKTVLFADGVPRRIEFQIELQSYGGDAA